AASSAEKLELCRQRGAEATVDYDREDLKSRIRELTGDAARVVLDPVGGPYAEPALRGLARGGTFITLGYAAGVIPSIPLNLVLLKGIMVRGMEIRTFVSDRPDDSARDMRELTQMFASGAIRPYIGARFALADTGAALRYVADRKAIGKVLIDVAGGQVLRRTRLSASEQPLCPPSSDSHQCRGIVAQRRAHRCPAGPETGVANVTPRSAT